jgi:hypothetical protein
MKIKGALSYKFSDNDARGSEEVLASIPHILRTVPHYWRVTVWGQFPLFTDAHEAVTPVRATALAVFHMLRAMTDELKDDNGRRKVLDAGWLLEYAPSRFQPTFPDTEEHPHGPERRCS